MKTIHASALACTLLLAAAPALAHGDRHARLDTDGNGQISRDEATVSPRLSLAFDLIDSNRDGQLDDAEREAFRERGQAARAAAHEARFAKADLDGDGRLSGDELAERRRLLRLDGNQDGAVDRAEWNARTERRRGRGRCAS